MARPAYRTARYDWRMDGALAAIEHTDPGGRPYFLADEVDAPNEGYGTTTEPVEASA